MVAEGDVERSVEGERHEERQRLGEPAGVPLIELREPHRVARRPRSDREEPPRRHQRPGSQAPAGHAPAAQPTPEADADQENGDERALGAGESEEAQEHAQEKGPEVAAGAIDCRGKRRSIGRRRRRGIKRMLQLPAPHQQAEEEERQVRPLRDRRHRQHVGAEVVEGERGTRQRHAAPEVGVGEEVEQADRRARHEGQDEPHREVRHVVGGVPGPHQRLDRGEEPGEAGGVERHPFVVELPGQQRPRVAEEGLRVPLVEDGERPAPVAVREEKGGAVRPGEEGQAQRNPRGRRPGAGTARRRQSAPCRPGRSAAPRAAARPSPSRRRCSHMGVTPSPPPVRGRAGRAAGCGSGAAAPGSPPRRRGRRAAPCAVSRS